jgi:hypothetical protein
MSRLVDAAHGSWYFAVQVPTGDGRRQRLRRGGFPSAEAAVAARDQVLAASPVDMAGQRWTVARWLERWLSTLPLQVGPSTLAAYRAHVVGYLIPHLGRLTLAGLRVSHLEAVFAAIAGHRTWTGRPVSAATVQRIRATLRRALNVAVRDQLLAVNPARLVVLTRAL